MEYLINIVVMICFGAVFAGIGAEILYAIYEKFKK